MERSRYIVLEGGEGVGKTTQVERLVGRLAILGVEAEAIREPGGDPMGEAIRGLLLDNDLDRIPETEVYLFNAARIQALNVIASKLRQGIWPIADRSRVSTISYQGYGHQLDLDFVRAISDFAVSGREPDLTLVLHAPHAVTRARRISRNIQDRFESMSESFHERVDRGYLEEAKRLDYPIIEASGSKDEVEAQIWQHVEPLLESTIGE